MGALLKLECTYEPPGALVQNVGSDSAGLRGGLRFCIPGGTDATGPQTTL